MSVLISVKLPKETARALEKLAKAARRPKPFLIRKALESYLAEYADYQIALDRLRDKHDVVIAGAELRYRFGI